MLYSDFNRAFLRSRPRECQTFSLFRFSQALPGLTLLVPPDWRAGDTPPVLQPDIIASGIKGYCYVNSDGRGVVEADLQPFLRTAAEEPLVRPSAVVSGITRNGC